MIPKWRKTVAKLLHCLVFAPVVIHFSISCQDDFLLRHYDSGECQGKLGHSRLSVILHRTQVSRQYKYI